jgi:hypothetical protein
MTALAKVEEVQDAQFQLVRPVNLRDGVSLMSVEKQNEVLTEYDKRRENFRKWLLKHLVQGVHYGFSPGCEPKLDKAGNLMQWNKKSNQYVTISKDSWQVKPSLYKAGAQLIVDLLKMRITFEADNAAWQQLGSKAGSFVFKCILVDPATGDPVGEGRGVFSVGEKGMNENAAIKMAQKRAMVDAVITTVAVCADLFTQDMEDDEKKPEPKPTPAKVVVEDVQGEVVEETNLEAMTKGQLWAAFMKDVDSMIDGNATKPDYRKLWAQIQTLTVEKEPWKALKWFRDNATIGTAEAGDGVQYIVKVKESK